MLEGKITVEMVTIAIPKIKMVKAAGMNTMNPEFKKNFGSNTFRWLAVDFSSILISGIPQKAFK